MKSSGLFLPVLLTCLGLAGFAGEPAPALPPLPEGNTGIASKYLHDFGIDKDASVVFADDFEQAKTRFENVWGGNQVVFSDKKEAVHSGKKGMEMTMHPPAAGGETSLGANITFKNGHDVLFVRYYAKYEKNMDMLHHNHNFASLGGNAPGVVGPQPGVPANGFNKFVVAMELYRDNEKIKAPGELQIYCYHPDQRSQWGDHFFPTGAIYPQPNANSIKNLFGPSFVPRPNFVPERDAWCCYELMTRLNTPGQRDGRIAFWIEGKLAADFPNLRFRETDVLKITTFALAMSTLNPAGNPNIMWFDDVVVATSYIGPMAQQKAAAAKTAANAKSSGDAPAAPAKKAIKPEALAPWEAKLAARVAQGIKDGQHPIAFLKANGPKEEAVKVLTFDGKLLSVEIQGNSMPMSWAKLSAGERFNLARAFMKESNIDDVLLAMAFALAGEKSDLADELTGKAVVADPKSGAARAADVRAGLGLK